MFCAIGAFLQLTGPAKCVYFEYTQQLFLNFKNGKTQMITNNLNLYI